MQKFDKLNNKYIFYDKYFGKQLSDEDFAQMLYFFLDNGVCFRSDLIPAVIKMLEDLQVAIEGLSSFRFFSSSLLLVYDGEECPQGLCGRSREEAKMVERMECIMKRINRTPVETFKDGSRSTINDKNGLDLHTSGLGVTDISHKDSKGISTSDQSISTDASDTPTCNRVLKTTPISLEATPISLEAAPTSLLATPHQSLSRRVISDEELHEIRSRVDLRMIDFAHSTHTGCTNDPVTYAGPDTGYLLGLKSLITIFRNMEK